MVIYEITAVVEQSLVEAYENYICERHIPDLLKTGYFRGARFTRSGGNRYRVHYEAFSQSALDEYLKTEAERLRADFLAYFPADIELSREVWEIVQIFNPDN
ncbi:MAG: DUF4286 family protein [Acidobacteria bacterium]|nr:DUF4286 family protein [Acidobacteriota bacterium]MCA1638894.1 DUF4286 family protein [Acidobacteriota bacterium]